MGPRNAKGGAPVGTKHKQKRKNMKKDQKLQKKMGGMTVDDSSSDDVGPEETTAADESLDIATPPTIINTLQLTLAEEWEQLEGAEVEAVTHQHKHTVSRPPHHDKTTIKGHTRGLFLQEAAFKKWWLSVNMTARKPGDMVKIAVVLMHADEAAAKQVELPDFWTEETARILGNHLEKLEMPLWDLDIEAGCRAYVAMQKQVQNARMEREHAKAEILPINDKLKKETKKMKEDRTDFKKRETKLVAAIRRMTKAGNKLANVIKANDLQGAAGLVGDWKKATSTTAASNSKDLVAQGNESDIKEADKDDGNPDEDEDESADVEEDDAIEPDGFDDDSHTDSDYVE